LAAIRDTGDLSDETEAALEGAVTSFRETFVPSETEAGVEAGAGEGSARDELKEDVGWDRMSSEDDEPPPPPTRDEMRQKYEEQAGPAGEADASFPG
ncbi:MAG TPA: hypothetical protein VFT27_13380, partial [Actinomycetota bacterium]|nr:hypothetical protein [Actinomycetota bacterium]